MGDTHGGASDLDPSSVGCVPAGAGGAPERVHHFTAPSGERVRLVASTVETGTDPLFDTVVYIRTACREPGSEIACNDDASGPSARPRASRASVEVAGGTEVYVVVDGYDVFDAGAYQLRVRAVPALPDGQACDPTGTADACRGSSICTMAGTGSPHCAPGTPPILDELVGQILENGRSVRLWLSGGDPDGDAVALHVDFLDAAASVVLSAERGLPSSVAGQTSFGPLVGFAQDGLLDVVPSATQATGTLIDGAGLDSAAVTVPLTPIPIRRLGEACDPAGLLDACQGEALCTSGSCLEPSSVADACAAAQGISGSTLFATTLSPGAGTFEGSCAYGRGFTEIVYRVTLAQPSDLRVSTTPMPSSTALDTALYVRSSCADPGTQIACNDNSAPDDVRSTLQLVDLPAGDLFVFVDGSRSGDGFVPFGPVGVDIEIVPIVGAGASCGATVDGGVPVGRCATGLSCVSGTCQ
jgi:hypothetical protein